MAELIPHNSTHQVTETDNTYALFERFFKYLDVAPSTVNTYKRSLKQYAIYLLENGIRTPTRDDILDYKHHLIEKGLAPTTIQTYLIAVRRFYRWQEQESIGKNIAQDVKGVKVSNKHKKDNLTSKQVRAVLKKMDNETEKDKRDLAIMVLMVTSGLRTVEVVRADVGDIRTVGDSSVLFIQGKGRTEKDEYIKLSDTAEATLRDYLATRPETKDSDPLFTSTSNNNRGERMTTRSISGIVKTALREAGFNSDRLTAHSLRHTAGTLNLTSGGTIEETQQLLRHSDINTTMIYLHHLERASNDSEQRISDAIFKD